MATINLLISASDFSMVEGQVALNGQVYADQVIFDDKWHEYHLYVISAVGGESGYLGLVRFVKKTGKLDEEFGQAFSGWSFWTEEEMPKKFRLLVEEIEKTIEKHQRRSDGELEWEYKKDGSTLKNVVYLGKLPKISTSWSQKKGYRWSVIFPGTFRLDIPQVHVNLGRWWNGLTASVRYAIKSFRSIKSGFVELQQQCNDGHESWWEVADGDNPYYVCALFADGKHIPLPILQRWVGQDGEISGGLIQQLAILLAGYKTPKNLEAALEACQEYVTKG